MVADESCLPFIALLDPNIVKSPADIHDSEILHSLELRGMEDLRQEWQGVPIPNCLGIQVLIVLNWSQPWINVWCIDLFPLLSEEE
jgi:hypothetical protein